AKMIYKMTYLQNTASNNYSDFSDLFLENNELMQGYDCFLKDNQAHTMNNQDEFEQYLRDLLVPRSGSGTFDALVWWKENKSKYPSVS
ncbi:1343_t:CDS:1, partial [Ambispora leptoticha]